MIRLFIFIILFVSPVIFIAQDVSIQPEQDSVYIPESADFRAGLTDRSDVSAEYDTSLFRSYLNNKDFEYNEVQKEESIWDIIKQQLYEWLRKFMGEAASGGILSWMIILLLIALAVFIFLRISDKNTGFYKDKGGLPKVIMDDDIQEIEFSNLIAEAERNQNFNEAIRYQFLNLLKVMISADQINWKASKTNTDYYYEIKDNQLKEEFKDLALIFDYADYSDFIFDQKSYNIAKSKFIAFMDKVGVKA